MGDARREPTPEERRVVDAARELCAAIHGLCATDHHRDTVIALERMASECLFLAGSACIASRAREKGAGGSTP